MTLPKAGRYELIEELGRGAMGVVYKAFDPMIRRPVAVKTMRLNEEGSGMARPELITRFQTEARAAGVLTHPNIVTVYDAGEQEGLFYITMEYVEGRSLQALIDQKQVFPLPRVMRIMEQACAALDFAHQHNVVHRDVKPANLMMTSDDVVKVSDFGTAKILQLGTTQTGSIIGTPSYMSPEQVKGKVVDGRSDIFSLGVILYELVTGEKPFPGQNVTTVIYKIVNENPVPPRDLDASIHPGLSAVISRALAKDPEVRFQTCHELSQALKHYREAGAEDLDATLVMMSRPRLPTLPPTAKTQAVPPPTDAPAPAQEAAAQVQPAPPPRPAPTPARSRPLTQIVYPDPAARSSRVSAWLVVLLIAILAGGGYLVWPTLRDTFGLRRTSPPPIAAAPAATPAVTKPPAVEKAAPPKQPASTEAAPAKKHAEPSASPPKVREELVKGEEPAVSPSTENRILKQRIEQRMQLSGLGSKVHVEAQGNVVTLTGQLTHPERRRLRMGLRNNPPPPGIRVVDHTEVAGGGGEPATEGGAEPEERPRTSRGMGEVEVFSDPAGAHVLLRGPQGNTVNECRAPCRFEDLAPGRYTLQVTKEGYRPVNRILGVRAGNITQENIRFQAETSGIQITSRPPRAEVLINGQAHSESTPTTVHLSPGSYSIVVQKPGFSTYQGTVTLRADELMQLNVELTEKVRGVGWVDLRTIPRGADILINDTNSGRSTPFRLELPAGRYNLTLYLKGYQPVRKSVVVEENQTVQINEALVRP